VNNVIVEKATSSDVVNGGNVIVVALLRVEGGKIMSHGGMHAMVGFGSVQMIGSMKTSPEPVPEPMSEPCKASGSHTLISLV